MTIVLAYALSLLVNLGVISSADVNQSNTNIKLVERDGKTVVVDAANGTELIVF